MAGYPSAAAIQPPVTVGGQKTNLADLLATAKQALGGSAIQSLTIASGSITPAAGATAYIRADTQGSASSDDLDRIVVTNLPDGTVAILQAVNDSRTVVAKHGSGGSGQLILSGALDFALDDSKKSLWLVRVGTSWEEIMRGYGADLAALRAYLDLGTAALADIGTGSGEVPLVDSILGRHTVPWPASAMSPASTNGCDPLSQLEITAGQPEAIGLDFDQTTQQFALFDIPFPKGWNRGTITASFDYMVDAAVSTTVRFQLQAVAISDGDSIGTAFGTAQGVTDTYHGTARKLATTAETPAITIAGSPAVGDRLFFRIARDPATDTTNSNKAKLLGVTIYYDRDALTDA